MVKSQHENGWSDSAGPWGQQRGQICPVGHLQRNSQDKSLTGMESWQVGTAQKSALAKDGSEGPFKDQSKPTYTESGTDTSSMFADLWKGAFLRRPQMEGVCRVTLTTCTHTHKEPKPRRDWLSWPCICHLGLEGPASETFYLKIHQRWTFWWCLAWMAHAWVPSDPLSNKGFFSSHTFGASLGQWGGVGWGLETVSWFSALCSLSQYQQTSSSLF